MIRILPILVHRKLLVFLNNKSGRGKAEQWFSSFADPLFKFSGIKFRVVKTGELVAI